MNTAHWALAAAAAAAVGFVGMVAAQSPSTAPVAESFSAPPKDSPEMGWWRESMMTRDQRIQWWRDARFGMFIHWGVYSELAGAWQGEPVRGYAEHIQRIKKIPIPVYKEQVVARFNPTKFDADAWVRLAKDAGMGYLIITSKHHDGFAMYDSKVSDYNIVRATPFARDPMRDLKAACDRHGIKFGFYYSQAFDWGEKDGAGNDWDYQNPGGDLLLHGGRNWWESSPHLLPQVRRYVDNKAIPQLQELIANYQPALVWFDTASKLPPSENLRILKAVRAAGPDVVVNSRIVGGLGDYESTADRPAEFPPHDGDWEAIPTTNESYGYHRYDTSHKTPEHFIQLIAKAAAKGGNLMLNVGPRGDGTIDPPDVAILEGIGRWMKTNAESIHGTTRTPLAVQAWGHSTRKGENLYLHVFEWPRDGKLVVGGLKTEVTGAYLLSDARKAPLKVQRVNDVDVRIDVPSEAPDPVDSVIVLRCAGDEVAGDPVRLLSPAIANELHVFDGQRRGKGLRYGQGKRQNAYVEQWNSPEQSVAWQVRLTDAAEYEVAAVYDAESGSAGGTYQVKVGATSFDGTVEAGKELSNPLGRARLDRGTTEIAVVPREINGNELMRLRAIKLTPVAR